MRPSHPPLEERARALDWGGLLNSSSPTMGYGPQALDSPLLVPSLQLRSRMTITCLICLIGWIHTYSVFIISPGLGHSSVLPHCVRGRLLAQAGYNVPYWET